MIIEIWSEGFDIKYEAVVDCSKAKAFDCLSYDILSAISKVYGCPYNYTKLFSKFCKWKIIENKNTLVLLVSVVQGSVLRFLLFIRYACGTFLGLFLNLI